MNENINMNPEGTGQHMTSTSDSAEIMSDSVASQNSVFTDVPAEEMSANADNSLYAQWVNIGLFVVVFAIFLFIYKQVNSLKWRLQEIDKKLAEQNKNINRQNKSLDTLLNHLDKLELNAEAKPTPKVKLSATKTRTEPEQKQKTIAATAIKSIDPEPEIRSTRIIKYATLQAPDANGTLRFAERSMTEEVTDQKMFEVELDTKTGTGTYRINQAAKSLIMNDLQQLREFVEPFTVNGNISAQRIIDDKPGKIHQEGKFWIVDELARIKIV